MYVSAPVYRSRWNSWEASRGRTVRSWPRVPPTSAETESALRLLDPQAVRLDEPDTGPGGRTCDVVLLASPGPGQIESAGLALEPGGWICVEASRSLLQRSGPRTLRGWKRTLERRGYQDVALYWNAPN